MKEIALIIFLLAAKIHSKQEGSISIPNRAMVTYYDPLLCPRGTPCLQGSGSWTFANGTAVTEDLDGTVGACGTFYYGATLTIPDVGTIRCIDNFGPSVHQIERGYFHVDIFCHSCDHWWNGYIIEGVTVSWE